MAVADVEFLKFFPVSDGVAAEASHQGLPSQSDQVGQLLSGVRWSERWDAVGEDWLL
jgi:hypothetical protein